MYVCMYAYIIHTCVHIYINIYVYTHTCIYTYMYIHVYVYTHICIHIYTYIPMYIYTHTDCTRSHPRVWSLPCPRSEEPSCSYPKLPASDIMLKAGAVELKARYMYTCICRYRYR